MSDQSRFSQVQQTRTPQSSFEELVSVLRSPDIATKEKRGIYLLFLLTNTDLLNTVIGLITDCYDSEKGCFEVPVNKESEYRTLVLLRFGIIKKVDKIRIRYEFVDVNKFIQILSLILTNPNLANILKVVNSPTVFIRSARSINNFLSYLVNFIQPSSISSTLSNNAISDARVEFNRLGLLESELNVVPTKLATELVNLIVRIKDIYVDYLQINNNTQSNMENLKELMLKLYELSSGEKRIDLEG